MNHPTARLPFFVYGALRPGQARSRALSPVTEATSPATLANASLWTHGLYPFILFGGDTTVTGDLVWVNPSDYQRTVNDLDRIEGYDPTDPVGSLFVRVTVTVTTPDGPVTAWTYVPSPSTLTGITTAVANREKLWDIAVPYEIPGGDWAVYTS